MKFGEIVESFSIPPHPKGISIEGKLVDLKPLNSNNPKIIDYANSKIKDNTNRLCYQLDFRKQLSFLLYPDLF